MKAPYAFAGRLAVVTGAGGGIGRALALGLAERGCALALVDRRADALAETAAEVAARGAGGAQLSQHVLDVADRAALAGLPAAVQQAHPGAAVHLLFNNAGVALSGTFEQVSEADFDWLMAINFEAVVRLTRLFLPLLRASGDGCLVNLSSVFGLIAPAGQTAYAAAKFAVRGFSNALRHELHGQGVTVCVVHPGGVATDIARAARIGHGVDDAQRARGLAAAAQSLRMPPERAAAIILRGVERRRPRILVGGDARLLSWLERLMPVGYYRLLQRRVAAVLQGETAR